MSPKIEKQAPTLWSRLRWGIWRAAHAGLVVLLAFIGAVLIGQIPVNRDFQNAESGIEMFIYVDSAHSEIIVPMAAGAIEWSPWFSANDFENITGDENFVSFGWGDREFFLNTPRWEDVRCGITSWAMLWPTPTVMHVGLTHRPVEDEFYHRVVIDSDAYQRMVRKIQASFVLDGSEVKKTAHPRLIAGRGYGARDAFYEAHGIYSAVYTCNAWTGDMLQTAGVRTGCWTPFPIGIVQFPNAEAKQ